MQKFSEWLAIESGMDGDPTNNHGEEFSMAMIQLADAIEDDDIQNAPMLTSMAWKYLKSIGGRMFTQQGRDWIDEPSWGKDWTHSYPVEKPGMALLARMRAARNSINRVKLAYKNNPLPQFSQVAALLKSCDEIDAWVENKFKITRSGNRDTGMPKYQPSQA